MSSVTAAKNQSTLPMTVKGICVSQFSLRFFTALLLSRGESPPIGRSAQANKDRVVFRLQTPKKQPQRGGRGGRARGAPGARGGGRGPGPPGGGGGGAPHY